MKMGMFQVKVKVANPEDAACAFEERFWVDTGVLYTCAPEDRLEAIGLTPKFARDFTLAEGRTDRRLVGEGSLTIEGFSDTISCLIVFGPPRSLFLLGVTALENFCVQADPVTQKLRPITAIMAGQA